MPTKLFHVVQPALGSRCAQWRATDGLDNFPALLVPAGVRSYKRNWLDEQAPPPLRRRRRGGSASLAWPLRRD